MSAPSKALIFWRVCVSLLQRGMTLTPEIIRERKTPTRGDAALFRVKTALLQARRLAADTFAGTAGPYAVGDALAEFPVIARSNTPLWTESEPKERVLVAGKIQNLRVAIARLDGVEVPAGEVFSFWKHVGRATRGRGFVSGRELREGCIIPNVGGGLCQLSNALYDASLQANFEIVERHRHTQVVAGSLAEDDRDATVFWNYVDLRFRSANPFRISARMDSENLIIEFRGEKADSQTLHQIVRRGQQSEPNSCATCGVGDCHRVMKPLSAGIDFGRAAWLVDEYFPEFDSFMQSERTSSDLLCIPLDGRRFRKGNYAWGTKGYGSVKQSLYVTALRSYRSRKLAQQGAARQLNLLAMYEALTESYARRLRFDVLQVTVQQNLLPFLWKGGHLGGRTFDVLMNALPMGEIQRRLDLAAELHPVSTTLSDFRADEQLIEAESDALKHARRIITPHTAIAELFPDNAVLLDWDMPEVKHIEKTRGGKPAIVFPASTVGRKGCYEVREAIRGLDVKLLTMGPYIEGKEFWEGFNVERAGDDWLERANAVVLPAFVEHKPRRLLTAAAAGIPVIASGACGVSNVGGVEVLPEGDPVSLREAIVTALYTVDEPIGAEQTKEKFVHSYNRSGR